MPVLSPDWQDWDVPDVLKDAVRPKQAERARREPAAPETPRVEVPRADVPKQEPRPRAFAQPGVDTFQTRIGQVAAHPAAPYLPAEVSLAVAASPDIDDPDKALHYLAREVELPLELFFRPWTAPSGYQLYLSPEGVPVSAYEARRWVDKMTPDILRGMIRGAVDQYDEITTTPGRRRKYRYPKVKVEDVVSLLSTIYGALSDEALRGVAFENVLGAAIQIAAYLRTPEERERFVQNLSMLGQQRMHWSLAVTVAEQAAGSGVVFKNPYDAVARSGLVNIDPAKLRDLTVRSSAETYGVRVWRDPQGGDHYYVWSPVDGEWVEVQKTLLGVDLPGTTPPRSPRAGAVATAPALKIERVSTPPTSWRDMTPTTPTRDGGTALEEPIDAPVLQLAGWSPGELRVDLTRPKDYFAEAGRIASEIDRRQRAWETSYLKVALDSFMHGLAMPFQWAEAALIAGFTGISSVALMPWAIAEELTGGEGFDTVGQYFRDMMGYASDVAEGRKTLGTIFAERYKLSPVVGTLLVDLPAGFVFDPLVMGPRALRTLQSWYRFDEALLGSRSFLGRQLMGLARSRGSSLYRLGEWLNRPPGGIITAGGERFEWLWNLGRKVDEAIGLPISGMYESRVEQLRAFVEMQLRRPHLLLGNKTYAEFLVDEALKGRNLYEAANSALHGYYRREAFPPELTSTIEGLIKVMKQAGEFDRADMVNLVDRVLLAHFGLKPMRAVDLELLMYRPAILGGSGAKMLRSGFRSRKVLVDTVIAEPLLPNTVGDPRLATAADVLAAANPGSRVLRQAQVERLVDFDISVHRSILDEAIYRLTGFTPGQFELPRPSFARRVISAYRKTDFAVSPMGRAIDALLFNRVPAPTVPFEEGRYAENIVRRMRRARVFTPQEIEDWRAKAHAASNFLNPQRERQMMALIDQLSEETFRRVGEQYNLSKDQIDLLWQALRDEADKINSQNAKRAFGVTLERDATTGEMVARTLDRPVAETQLLNAYYAPDPLAMRRVIREHLNVRERVESLLRSVRPDLATPPAVEEFVSSPERTLFLSQLDDTLERAGWQPTSRKWAASVWDQIAVSAVTMRPDLYSTVDDFWRSVRMQYLEEAPRDVVGFAKQQIRAMIDSNEVTRRWADEVAELLKDGGGEELWYEASKRTLDQLGPVFFWGTTRLRDGTEISDYELFMQILAMMSPQRAVSQNLYDALDMFVAIKSGAPIGRVAERIDEALAARARGKPLEKEIRLILENSGAIRREDMPSIEAGLDDILAGSKRVSELPKDTQAYLRRKGLGPDDVVRTTVDNWHELYTAEDLAESSQKRLKVWNFWRNLLGDADNVTIDSWMGRALLGRKELNAAEYHLAEQIVRDVAKTLGIRPAQAQAAIWVIYKRQYADELDRLAGEVRLSVAEIEAGRTDDARQILRAIEQDPYWQASVGSDAEQLKKWRSAVRSLDPEALRDRASSLRVAASNSRDARSFAELVATERAQEKLQEIQRLSRERLISGMEGLRKEAEGRTLGLFQPTWGDVGGVITLFKEADPRTFVHEAGHFIRRLLSKDELRSITEWLAETDPMFRGYLRSNTHPFEALDPAVRRRAEELFAEAFERYLWAQTAPPKVEGVFARIRDWLARVWEKIRGTALEPDPRLRPVFDRWLPRDAIGSAWRGGAPVVLEPSEIERALKRVGHWLAYDVYLRWWKPAQVLRLGYIMRVPGLDEQIRFLTDLGMWARLRSQGFVGRLLVRAAERGPVPKGWVEEPFVIRAADGTEHVVTRVIPGALPDEVYANSEARLNELFPTMMEQVRSLEKGAMAAHQLPVGPEDARYAQVWDTAVNGHIGQSILGRRALYGFAVGKAPEEVAQDLARFVREDPIGQRIYARMSRSVDEIDSWAELYADMVWRYILGDQDIALAALRRRASAQDLDAVLARFTEAGRSHINARLVEGRTLPLLDDANFARTARKLRLYIREHSGATFDPVTGKFIEQGGYAVGMTDRRVLVVPEAVLEDQAAFEESLRTFIERARGTLEGYDGANIGAWIEDGMLHLDPSEVIKDFDVAMGAAILRKQQGIYHFDTGRFIPTITKPVVHGQVLQHMSGNGVSPAEAFVDIVSRYILQLPTNRLSRQPFFKAWYDRIMELQTELLRGSGWTPRNAEEAERAIAVMQANARRFALDRVNRVMFNFREQNRLSELAAFVVPFAQPWFEAFQVYGHLLRRNPALIGWARLAFQTARESGFLQQDPDTGEWYVPMSNFAAMAPLMAAISGWDGMRLITPLSSFNLFFNNAIPLDTGAFAGVVNVPAPSLSPPVTWLLQQVIDDDQTSALSTWLYQYGRVGVDGFLPLPTWLQYALTSVGPEWLRQALGTSDAWKAYVDEFLRLQQRLGIEYDSAEEAVQAAERDAKTFFRYRAVMGFLFPGSVRVEFKTKALEDKWRRYQELYGPEARDRFLAEHPDQWLIATSKTLWYKPDPNLPESVWSQMPSVPASPEADAVLQHPEFREFAARFPAMAWAIVISVTGPGKPDYSPDILMRQLAQGDRRYKDPVDFYESGQAAAGWTAYWHLREWWDAREEYLRLQGVQENDPEWQYARAQYEERLNEIRRMYPAFSDEFGTMQEQRLDPRVLKYARALVRDPVFMDFPIGQALGDYLELRDEIRAEMSRLGISSIDSASAVDAGLASRYEQGVQEIIARVPEFERLYRVMFEGADLHAVQPEIEREVAALPSVERQRIFEWQRRWNDLEESISLAPDDRTRASLYRQQYELVKEAYTYEVNPMRVWYETQPYSARQEYLRRLWTKPVMYMNRFDRELLGIPTSEHAEEVWRVYLDTRSQIYELDLTDPNFSVSAAYRVLDEWVREQAANDPIFAQQVELANTWGGVFAAYSGYAEEEGPAGDAWRALLQTVRNYQQAVEAAGLHGVEGDEEQYADVRRQFIAYVEKLKAWNATFAAEWDALEAASSQDLVDTFVPPVWFRMGGS